MSIRLQPSLPKETWLKQKKTIFSHQLELRYQWVQISALKGFFSLALVVLKSEYSGELGHCHCCWCPDSLRHQQVISNDSIKYGKRVPVFQ